MSEQIIVGTRSFTVSEIFRDQTLQCRVLEASDGTLFLEYLASVGPYKIDVPTYVQLSAEQQSQFRSGTLELSKLLPEA